MVRPPIVAFAERDLFARHKCAVHHHSTGPGHAQAKPGDEVLAGTLNTQGSLIVQATKAAAESTLSRVAALVEAAQGGQAPSERCIDRFARVYTPLVFAAALVLAVLPPLVFGADVDTWVYRALALLIVACPCSLVISVPVAVVQTPAGRGRAHPRRRAGRRRRQSRRLMDAR